MEQNDSTKNIRKKMDKRKLAYLQRTVACTLTIACYRNLDIVENSHCRNISCDKKFYDDVYIEVTKQIGDFPDRLIRAIETDGFSNDPITAWAVIWGLSASREWDKPVQLKGEICEDKAKYLLCGKFAEACENNWVFHDGSMKIINQDVNNRMYTLIRNNIISLDRLDVDKILPGKNKKS